MHPKLFQRGVAIAALAGLVSAALVTGLPTSAPAASTSQDWPMFLHDAARTATTTDATLSTANASQLNVKWKLLTGAPIATSVSIVGTTAYAGSWDGYEYAVNTSNGSVIWKRFLGQTVDPACPPSPIGVTSSAAVVAGTVYVGGGDSYWYALNATTGAVRWKVFTGDNTEAGAHYNWSSPLIVNGYAYIGIASNCDAPLVQGQLLKVSLSSHQVVSTFNTVPDGQLGGGIWTSPSYDASTNTIFVSTGTLNNYQQTLSQAIIAFDANTLAVKSYWQLPFDAAVFDSDWGTTPTLTTDSSGDQLLSVANKNGVLYTFNRNNLAAGPIWQTRVAIGGDCPQCGDGDISSGAFNNNVLYYASGHVTGNGKGSGGSIRALDAKTGNVIWVRQTDQPIYGSPAYVNGMVLETSGDTLEVLNASTGALLYSYVLGGTAFGAVTVAYGQIYVGATDGNLYAFNVSSAPAAPPTDANCPSGFACQNIGGVSGGSESTSSGVLTVNGRGTGIGGTSDQFRLVSKPVTGDSQDSVQVRSQNGSTVDAGLIVRQPFATSTRTGSRYYAVVTHSSDSTDGLPQPDVEVWTRTGEGTGAFRITTWYPAAKPVSVMLQRSGNLFSAGVSFDGVHYTLIPGSTQSLDLPTTTLQGLVVDSGSSSTTGSAAFSGLAAAAGTTTTLAPVPPAHACPSQWTCTDLGNPNPVGDTTSSGGTITLAGTGSGVDNGSDSVHYVYQSVSGNEQLSAHVVTGAGPSVAEDGLMMRESSAPTAPMYSVYLVPGGGATVRWRAYDNVANAKQFTIPNVGSPAYLQIVRYLDNRASPPATFFSTATSSDGVNWSVVPGSTIAIDMGSGSYLAGLMASGDPGTTTSASFDSISLTAASSAPPSACPTGFTCSDLGSANAVAGSQIYTNGTWTMDASGDDIWDVFDSFRFAYQPFPNDPANSPNGDGTFSAEVVSQSNVGGPWMKSGVMIRSGTDGGAPYYGAFVTPSNGVVVQWRPSQGAVTSNVQVSTATTPIWLLVSRYTDTAHNVVDYSAYTSTDGAHFTFIPGSTVALNLPGPLIAGIASDSYDSKLASQIVFQHVAQIDGSSPPPFLCPSAWTCTDVGGALPPGQDQLSSGTWNEQGGGGDIWDVFDQFHFVSQTVSADGTVSAHVTAQQATDPWAKAGVMLRGTTDPASPYYAAFVTPGNGIAVQWRAAQGAATSQLAVPGAVPAYLRVARYTSGSSEYFTAYTSTDGTTWTAVAGSTQVLNLTGPLLGGFAITSHDQGVASAVTLDGVAIATGAPPPPIPLCPSTWTCADIGGAAPPGTQTLSSGSWTIQGGGGDIWDVSDEFHFVWQSLAADGSISTRVASQSNTDPWAKAGVMLR
ncbi:MAG: PQQ-binding-like beta-propeller repeat protein, partial [Actinobacteria bacterium]|nr:PQQ-binding-like beta-propeller repeat protein [Actinomycetota bacterium]